MTALTLPQILQQRLRQHPKGDLCVAFSGGPDSSALLHALGNLPAARARALRAVHIDHGLHPDSRAWAEHCRVQCAQWHVPLRVQAVHVDGASGRGIEAAAREARYAALAADLHAGELLLTAQHRDDQVETVLLKLLRGAGPEGLGGMRRWRALGAGQLWRPLRETPRNVLQAYVRAQGLACISDPSNGSPHLARSYLRTDIVPHLQPHWPQLDRAVVHSAHLQRQAADFITLHADQALQALRAPTDGSLDAAAWLALHPALHMPVLQRWLHALGLNAPGQVHYEQLCRQIQRAHGGRVPLIRWPGTAIHIWRQRLHAHPPLAPAPGPWQATWQGAHITLPAAAGRLRWAPVPAGTPPALLVRLGAKGVRLRVAGDGCTRTLRDLFQRAGIPPWQRPHCPLIHATDGTLLAVADLWQTAPGQACFAATGSQPRWEPLWPRPAHQPAAAE